MKEEKDKLRDFMQEVFHEYEAAPDPQDWNRIEKTLSKKKRRVMLWVIWASAASLLLLLALYTGGILNRSDNRVALNAPNLNQSGNVTVKPYTSSKLDAKASAIHNTNKNQLPAEGNPAVHSVKTIPALNIPKSKSIQKPIASVKKDNNGALSVHKKNLPESGKVLLAANSSVQPKDVSNAAVQNTESIITVVQNENLLVHSMLPKTTTSVKSNTLFLDYNRYELKPNEPVKPPDYLANNSSNIKVKGLSLNNSSGLIMQSSSKDMMSYSRAFASQLTSNMYMNSVKVFDNSLLSSLNIGNLFQNNKRDYLPPVTFGLNINLSLQNNWSVETGIQYTRLQSNGNVSIQSSNSVQIITSYGYKVDESLHYLGVPIILNYSFSQNRKTSFYVSTGFSIEKGIIAKYKAVPVDHLPGMEPIYSQNSIKGLQYSVNSGIGISYRFISHFELFGQPSLSYYFNSRGVNTTIYSVHPWLFNLRSGIRYTFR